MKIMVVDDEPLINQYIVQCIRNADPESEIVGAVTSGAKALKKLEETPVPAPFGGAGRQRAADTGKRPACESYLSE